MKLSEFKKLPLLGILRDVDEAALEPLMESIIQGGLKAIEITMNTKDAPELIKKAIFTSKGNLTIGAGTVLSKKDLHAALDAGASFIVSPTAIPEVIEHCLKNNIPVFPGALTPQEIFNAHNLGATMVKVFPAKVFGPAYMKEIKGPLQNIELLACGGVTKDNIQLFFSSGASGIAFGGSVFNKEWLRSSNFDRIKKEIQELVAAYKLA